MRTKPIPISSSDMQDFKPFAYCIKDAAKEFQINVKGYLLFNLLAQSLGHESYNALHHFSLSSIKSKKSVSVFSNENIPFIAQIFTDNQLFSNELIRDAILKRSLELAVERLDISH